MSLFQTILKNITNKITHDEQKQSITAKICSEVIGVTIVPDKISFRNEKIYITVSPTIKSAIKLHTPEIIEALQKEHIQITTIG